MANGACAVIFISFSELQKLEKVAGIGRYFSTNMKDILFLEHVDVLNRWSLLTSSFPFTE